MKPRVREVIVVEGRYDKNTLLQAVDAVVVETGGFAVFRNGEKAAYLRRLAEKLGRPPKRKEAPEALRKDLQKWCGSWSNTLFQLGLQPEKKKTFQGTKEPRE